MRYAILGSAQAIRGDGTPVALGGARLRALLTALALRPGRAVPAEVLVGEVWGEEPPQDASGALQALIGRLRRAAGHGAVASEEGGYRLTAERDDIDLYRFERLARTAARHLEAGEPGRAAELYDEALALWRGPALADLPDPAAEAARWETVRLDARRGRLGAALALGEAERALPELAALCADLPLDEPLQVLRIRALRDAGRPAEALAAYDGVRRDLADRLGADPGPALRALHTELLAPPPAAQTPAAVTAPAPPAPVPAAPDGAAPDGNLRARLTTFVGREDDIRVIGADLAGARLVTLLGPGGAGKTRLSQEAAEAHARAGAGPAHWPDGVWMVELAPVDDPEDVAEAALAALGARETKLRGAAAEELRVLTGQTGDHPLERLTEHCSRRRMLLLLDNCEHVIGAAAELAERLLTHCPGVQILATSREPLGVPGELLRPVEPLPDPMAVRLFAERGAAARPGFTVADDPAAAAEICRRLDGLPLAIELAAARLRLLTPRQIADRLDNRFRLLTSGSRTVLPRQQTLRAVVDWSWDLLDAPERTVLARLSVFAGGCDLTAAEAVCAQDGADGDISDVADVLGSLVDKSLVVAAPGPGGDMRYRLLETVGEYAAERLAATAADQDATGRRHLVHYREFARTTDPLLRGRGQREGAERLATEYENLRTALRRAVATRDAGEALCLVHALFWYWQMRDLRSEMRHWTNAVAALGPDPFAQPVTPAQPVYEQVVDTPPPYTGELLTEAWRGIGLLQLAARDQSNESWFAPDLRPRIDGMVAAYRPGLPQICRNPGSLWIYAAMIGGDPGALRRIADDMVETSRRLGYRWELGSALQLRANVLANRADWAGNAARDADESLAIFEDLGDDWGCAEALSARAESREKRGEYALAAEDYRAAIGHAERLGARGQVLVLRVRMAGVLLEDGGGEQAEEILTEVLAAEQRFGGEAMPPARMFLATRLGSTGRIPEARAQLQDLREEFAYGVFAVFDGFLQGIVAWLDNEEGKHEDALAQVRLALTTFGDPLSLMVSPQMPAVYLLAAAEAHAGLGGSGHGLAAARLFGAYRALLPPAHVPVTTERAGAARTEEWARAVLGDAAFEAAYAEGGGLSLEEATALV
ncbi:winged helix-turn-helix domain-containing protein [Streptomyces sp. NBC_00536]|uniref:AfsR/SARP family transcriptional regulator n=1 Tax=Streptomyces sp. NBC_00536 TaxID=2975769 RepID=UPI002E81CAA2|nr:BTAD domain-containing putative transcriptional regulator [Streptomyces sp. NBC_00536]WUC78742.1 winged helix-turn-helix domain-containing protein [Streptomyces sp. NBC_00536]